MYQFLSIIIFVCNFSIISGPRHFPGIYVEVVKQNSLAEKVGMEAGDQILKVNDTSFIDTTHNEVRKREKHLQY
jgi:S1-C subfamily serine protease